MAFHKYFRQVLLLSLGILITTGLSSQHIEPNGIQVTGGSNIAAINNITGTPNVAAGPSMCLGRDCFVGIPFNFSTVIMRENNLRIKFEDTSNPAGPFPSHDWELIGNLNGDGSPNEFLIWNHTANGPIVRIKGGTPSNTIVVDASGYLGLGTLAPQQTVHLARTAPRVRLDQNSTMGYVAQTWDLSGDATEFALHNINNGNKILRMGAGAPEHSFVLDSTGHTGIGTGDPEEKLHVTGDMKVHGDMTVKGMPIISDIRVKQDISSAGNVMAALSKVRPVSYRYSQGAEIRGQNILRFGMIAHEVKTILPQLTGQAGPEEKEYLTIDYVGFIPLLVGGVQEVNTALKEIATQSSTINTVLGAQDAALSALQADIKELKFLLDQ